MRTFSIGICSLLSAPRNRSSAICDGERTLQCLILVSGPNGKSLAAISEQKRTSASLYSEFGNLDGDTNSLVTPIPGFGCTKFCIHS